MVLSPGTQIGAYQILAKLGAGGMGEVYRARDSRLKREVALKVLPAEVASDRERLARFQREAEVLASLNHSHIAQIYGLEESAPVTSSGRAAVALVMELVEGEDLLQRTARGPIPTEEALPIARQIAEALQVAHDAGIIHRDLKPANIKVKADGTVKVLDFGLAKAIEPDSGSRSAAHSPTITSPANTRLRQGYGGQATEAGVILGTAAYMSPEQARGKGVDKRSDIWAFGVVLFEMLTGNRLFDADEITDVLAAVLRQPIDLAALPPETPAPVRRLLRRCLERDRDRRLSDIADARLEIDDAIAGGEPDPITTADSERTQRIRWVRVATVLAIVSAALAAALAVRIARAPDPVVSVGPAMRFALSDNRDLRITVGTTSPFSISRDGRTVAFSANTAAGTNLWVRTVNDAEPRMLEDTAGAHQPAISPDGEWVAFVVANHTIRKTRISGGRATTLVSLDDLTAALAWESNDAILFEKIGSSSGIHRVSANGGDAQVLIPLESGERNERRPFVLSESRLVLYASTSAEGRTTLAAFSLPDGRRSRLDVDGVQVLGMVGDDLVYARSDGSLMAVPFDARTLRVTGAARQLADRVLASTAGVAVSLSEAGTLVFAPPASPLSRIVVGDETGRTVRVGDLVRPFAKARLSPDARRIAVGIAEGDGHDLWIVDRATAEATRVTKGGLPVTLVDWTPDGRSLIHVRGTDFWTVPVDGSAEPRRLAEGGGRIMAAAMTPDGRSAVVWRRVDDAPGLPNREEFVRIPLGGSGQTESILTSRSSGANLRVLDLRVSPDGRWAALNDRNEEQVHVRSLADGSGIQVSDAGGDRPVWAHDSRRLFYQTPAGISVVELQTSPSLSIVRRQRLPAFPVTSGIEDISADGQTFLMLAPIDSSPRVIVAVNWAEGVRQLLRGKDDLSPAP